MYVYVCIQTNDFISFIRVVHNRRHLIVTKTHSMITCSTIKPSDLRIGCWNVEGTRWRINDESQSKFEYDEFISTIRNYHILCLQEMHCNRAEIIKQTVENYHVHGIARKKPLKRLDILVA